MTNNPLSHHRRSIRLNGYDYSQPGAYFVTIVSHKRQNLFGEITHDEMHLNGIGVIIEEEWQRLPQRFPHVRTDIMIVMPNHLHGILVLECRGTGATANDPNSVENPRAPTAERFGQPTPGTIPTIIRSYKSSVTQRVAWMPGRTGRPLWQRNYYEHVVRNEADLNRIRQYILDNPTGWPMDEENL
jgi:REP-associated tyrosine transposase